MSQSTPQLPAQIRVLVIPFPFQGETVLMQVLLPTEQSLALLSMVLICTTQWCPLTLIYISLWKTTLWDSARNRFPFSMWFSRGKTLPRSHRGKKSQEQLLQRTCSQIWRKWCSTSMTRKESRRPHQPVGKAPAREQRNRTHQRLSAVPHLLSSAPWSM